MWVGLGIAVAALATSMGNVKNSVVGAKSEREVMEQAARAGDYELAKELYGQCQVTQCHKQVLGAESALEELVYPEEKLAREIVKWELARDQYPSNREIMRGLAELYEQAGEIDKANFLREEVRIMDPNE